MRCGESKAARSARHGRLVLRADGGFEYGTTAARRSGRFAYEVRDGRAEAARNRETQHALQNEDPWRLTTPTPGKK